MKNSLCILGLALLTASCNKYRCPQTIYCSVGYNFVFVGFDTSELSTYILRAYKADNTFSTLIDTAIVSDTLVKITANGLEYALWPLYGREQDSLIDGSQALDSLKVSNVDTSYIPYDWEIYIPKDARTFRVTGIKFTGAEKQTVESCDAKGNSYGGSCYLEFGAYTVDGRTYTGPSLPVASSPNFIFLKK